MCFSTICLNACLFSLVTTSLVWFGLWLDCVVWITTESGFGLLRLIWDFYDLNIQWLHACCFQVLNWSYLMDTATSFQCRWGKVVRWRGATPRPRPPASRPCRPAPRPPRGAPTPCPPRSRNLLVLLLSLYHSVRTFNK